MEDPNCEDSQRSNRSHPYARCVVCEMFEQIRDGILLELGFCRRIDVLVCVGGPVQVRLHESNLVVGYPGGQPGLDRREAFLSELLHDGPDELLDLLIHDSVEGHAAGADELCQVAVDGGGREVPVFRDVVRGRSGAEKAMRLLHGVRAGGARGNQEVVEFDPGSAARPVDLLSLCGQPQDGILSSDGPEQSGRDDPIDRGDEALLR